MFLTTSSWWIWIFVIENYICINFKCTLWLPFRSFWHNICTGNFLLIMAIQSEYFRLRWQLVSKVMKVVYLFHQPQNCSTDQWYSFIFFMLVIWPYGHLFWELWHRNVIACEFRYCLIATYVDWNCHSKYHCYTWNVTVHRCQFVTFLKRKLLSFVHFKWNFTFRPTCFKMYWICQIQSE